jgi:phage terminase small subunit
MVGGHNEFAKKAPFHIRHPALTLQEELFCREYLKDRSPMNAAIRAGYKQDMAKLAAIQLMKRP